MSHLDEGTLHALLDGELGGTALMEIEAHLGGCAACSARLQEARGFMEEADRLVGSVQVGGHAAAAPASPPPPPSPAPRTSWDDTSPVLLIPDNPESVPLIRRWPRAIGWAASIAIVVSVGYYASSVRRETAAPAASSQASGTTVAAAAEPATSPPADALRKDSESPSLADQKVLTQPPAAAKPAAPKREKAAANVSSEEAIDAAQEKATRAAERDAIRARAALELSRASAAAAATPEPAPPPTMEQRAQVYTRIGLDEASKQLGGPAHVIEGMSPLFMGLAQGRVAAGADTTRPVVRVVYLDSQGRMILLDQQRNLPGQSPTPTAGSWTLGDLTMGLHGEAPPDVLRTLRSRVR